MQQIKQAKLYMEVIDGGEAMDPTTLSYYDKHI
jgi:hypothetical protein